MKILHVVLTNQTDFDKNDENCRYFIQKNRNLIMNCPKKLDKKSNIWRCIFYG